MYSEDNTRERSFTLLKNFILRLILIVIFVLLLVKFVPWPNYDDIRSSLKGLQSQIFTQNITTMKEAAIPYFTTERLPENVGDSVTLTLKDMLDLKLLVPFVDKNGDTCDLKKSYVTLTKKDNEYLMKVNLKCGEEEDYILVHLGCYSYCQSAVCEKQVEVKPTSKPSKPNTKPVTKPATTATVKPPVKTPIKPTVTPKPPVPQQIICSIVNGVFYDNKGNVTSEANYNNVCGTVIVNPPAPDKPEEITPSPSPVVNYEYEYKKTTDVEYSDWSGWKVWSYTDNDTVNWKSTELYQIEDLGAKKVQIGTQTNTAVAYRDVLKDFGNASYKVCAAWSYTADATTLYKITSDWSYTDDYYRGYNPPADTMTTRWIIQDYKVNECVGTCTDHVYFVYRKQVRTVSKTTEYTNVTADCSQIETRNVPIQAVVSEAYTYKTEVPVYGYKKYYRDRTRTIKANAKIQYAWSIYNDSTLLNSGWTMTGNSRRK